MQLNFVWDNIWNQLRRISMSFDWILARTQFGIVLEKKINPMRSNWVLAGTEFGIVLKQFRWDAIEFWWSQNLELSQKDSDEMQLNFGWDRFWNCLRKIPMRCNWTLAQTKFGMAMKLFWWDAIESWLRQNFELS